MLLLVMCVISSCEEEKVEEPYFQEGFTEVDDYIMRFQPFFNATKGIESEYRERNKVALEFYADPEYIPNVNPYEGKIVNLYPEYVDNYVQFPVDESTWSYEVSDTVNQIIGNTYKYMCGETKTVQQKLAM